MGLLWIVGMPRACNDLDLGLDGRHGFLGVEHFEDRLDVVRSVRGERDDPLAGLLEWPGIGVVRRRLEPDNVA